MQLNSNVTFTCDIAAPLISYMGAQRSSFSPFDYGAQGGGTADDTVPVRNAFAAAIAAGGTVDFGSTEFRTTGPVTVSGPVKMRGAAGYPSGGIVNSVSDLFTVVSGANVVTVENCALASGTGGGHIFSASGASVSAWKFTGTYASQANASKAIWYQYQGGAIDFSIEGNCLFYCSASASLAPMSFLALAGACNSVKVSRSRFTGGASMTVPFFSFAPDYGARTDTGVGMTAGSPTVTDTSAVAADLGLRVYSSNFAGGSGLITAVTPGAGYTVTTSATATLAGQTCLIGLQGWYEELKFDHVVWELLPAGAIWGNGIYGISIEDCAHWDIAATSDVYHFCKGSTGYHCQGIAVKGGRGGAVSGGAKNFFADANCLNIKLDSFGQGWATAPVISSPAAQTTIINGVNGTGTPVAQIPGLAAASLADVAPADTGAVAWTGNPKFASSVKQLGRGAGVKYSYMVKAGAGGTVTAVKYAVISATGTGLANCFIGIYDNSATCTLLAQCTTDQSASLAAVGVYTAALSSAVTLAPGGLYRLEIVIGSVTAGPTLLSHSLQSVSGVTNLGASSPLGYQGDFQSGSFTSLPASYARSSAVPDDNVPVLVLV